MPQNRVVTVLTRLQESYHIKRSLCDRSKLKTKNGAGVSRFLRPSLKWVIITVTRLKKFLLNIKCPILGNFEQYGFVWVWCSKIWFTTVALTENKVEVDLLNIFHYNLPFFQAFLKWQINNKLKVILVFIFSMFYSTLLYSVWRNASNSWGSKPLEKPWTSNSKP